MFLYKRTFTHVDFTCAHIHVPMSDSLVIETGEDKERDGERRKSRVREGERSNSDGSSNQCREMKHERNGASEEVRSEENLLHLWHGTRWTMKKERDEKRQREGEVMAGSVSC